jgi:hypothetical protein
MNGWLAGIVTWIGGGAIASAAVAAVALNLAYGESVFTARLVAGLANCL